MVKIAFIGIGNMGMPMAINLAKAGFYVSAFDLAKDNLDKAKEKGIHIPPSANKVAHDADFIITMLPNGDSVKAVYEADIFPSINGNPILIDCSTIDLGQARDIAYLAKDKGLMMLDAPVSGGVGGAVAGTLTFMVGGALDGFEKAHPIFEAMGKAVIHCGDIGSGQAAKMCNNMMLGIQMTSVVEAFTLARKVGLDPQKLFDVSSKASGQCWSLTTYCPEPGLVATSPANHDYQAGFSTMLMNKDMGLALKAANEHGLNLPSAKTAAILYQKFIEQGQGEKDFSGIMKLYQNESDAF